MKIHKYMLYNGMIDIPLAMTDITPPVCKLAVSGREVRVLGSGRREILISRAETKRQAIAQLADFIHARCMEVGI